jgi:chaperonin GroES
MSFNPVRDRVVARPVKEEKVSLGGIVLPGVDADKPNQAEVLAVGPGYLTKNGNLIPLDIQVGDQVMYFDGVGQTVKINGETLIVLKEEEIYAVNDARG